MNHPNGPLWVDPEGVISVGDTYLQHIERYDECLRHLGLLRARYALAWGDDDMGNQFQKRFDSTMDGVEGSILGVRGYLEYAVVGLRVSGEGYRQADEDAAQAGRRIAADFTPLSASFAAGPDGDAQDPVPLTPAHAVVAFRVEEEPAELTPTRSFVAFRAEAPGDGEPAQLTPLIPAISAFRTYDTTGLFVDGEPIPPGYQLQTLTTFPDGTSRIDANYYDSVIPLGTRQPTTADGRPVDPSGDQFFLVKRKEDAAVEPSAPGYRPLLISFKPDGSATPMTVDPG
ncbi:hypothetical protein [Micromonospora sp. WMMD975]|uniref:hypothetical protein n=1 Tax=Micromonospora sp. WMMD975 TaxID=3016087 RepID=UPI00249B802E|nr:hypothetical protein [Micromonospora sp. WMMD975]WFE34597.1 hypothetical protein O7613_04215 [Micromonospora sp. WMMD975]